MTARARIAALLDRQDLTPAQKRAAVALLRRDACVDDANRLGALRWRAGERIEVIVEDVQRAEAGVDVRLRCLLDGAPHPNVDPHHVICNPPTLAVDPDGEVDLGDGRFAFDRPALALRDALQEAIRTNIRNLRKPSARTTYTIYAASGDGGIQSQSTVYATARSGSALVVQGGAGQSIGQTFGGSDYYCAEAFFAFDTSGIPSGDTIDSATLALYGSFSSTSSSDFVIQARSLAFGTLTTADWVAGADLGSYDLLATLDTSAGFSTSAYNDLSSEAAFVGAINASGDTELFCSSSRHLAGNTPTGGEYVQVRMSEQAGTSQDPKLTVETSPGGSVPAAFMHYQRMRCA